ncbi:MAG TPA: RNA polymerase sigma-54 factor, partial [Isosphaeraceae bacterium]|nr:RNA polymerase sigma-54 factor [Isosphaeraceae bacterium]
MRLDTSQQMRTDMRLRMAPRMIQSMEILQLPVMALQERIDQELIENPLLIDLRESTTPESDGENEETASAASETAQVESEPEADGQFDESVDEWFDQYGETHRPSRAALAEESDRKHDAMQNMANRPRSIHDDLNDQLGFLDCDPTIRALAEYIIYNLDEHGYLLLDLNEVVRDFGGDASLSQAEEALGLVQKLDPPGIGARNLR